MLAESIELADDYWSAEFGCDRLHLRPDAPHVQHHAGGLSDYAGAFFIVLDAAPVVSVPSVLLNAVAPRADQFVAEAIRDVEALRRLLAPGTVTKVIGPALLNYADRSCFVPTDPEDTRELLPRDEASFLVMRAACPPEEWEAKDFSLGSQPTFGAFTANGELVAIANIRVWADRIAHISVVARPGFRGQGFGTRAVAVATGRALDIGLLPQYRVLESNAPSRRVARKLGFQSYGWTGAARLAQA
jgi:RimJ/RimL family protein N-acetyltransferase